jgi:hypothetical protein
MYSFIYLGLHTSKTYSEGEYDSPIPDVSLRVEIAKHNAPLLFDLMMVLVCSKHNQKDAIANSNRINSLTELFENNRKKGKENTIQGILDACYGKRVPNHVKTALDSVCTPDSVDGSVGSRTTNHNGSSGSGGYRLSGTSSRVELESVPSSSNSGQGCAEHYK